MKTNKQFTVGTNGITWINSNFQNWFGSSEVKLPKKVDFTITKLTHSMNDREILAEIKPNKYSLGDVLYALKNNLIQREWWGALFYVEDSSGVLRAVRVLWYGVGWYVNAYSVEGLGRWNVGFQVFSRNSVLKPSDAYKQGYEDGKKAERERILSLI